MGKLWLCAPKPPNKTWTADVYKRQTEILAKLRPAFKQGGTVTAGNASGLNDGAAALVIMSAEKAQELGIKPMAKILSYASAGVDPAIMGIGPIPASRKALSKAGLEVKDLDLIEANEAFAAQFVEVGRELNFDPDKVNVNGCLLYTSHNAVQHSMTG